MIGRKGMALLGPRSAIEGRVTELHRSANLQRGVRRALRAIMI